MAWAAATYHARYQHARAVSKKRDNGAGPAALLHLRGTLTKVSGGADRGRNVTRQRHS